MSGSIVANNTPKNCFHAVIDQGYNLESGTDCDFSASTDLQNTDPKLAPLSDNGGSAQRLALLDGSPAINHGGSSCPAIDQRGITRPQGPACDIGAFEFRVPTLNVPSRPIMVDATSSQGASVTYAVTAGLPDDTSSSPALKCVPASGSTFLIGTTTVNCTASDQAQPPDTTSGSFQVVIKGAAAQISDLTDLVNSFGLPGGLQTSLDAKLQDALAAVNAGNTATACSDLTDFIGAAQAQAGKKLTQSQAQQVVAATQQIQAVLGC